MNPILVSNVRHDLREYRSICDRFGYQPSKEDIDNAIKFILLMNGADGTVTESMINEDDIPFSLDGLGSVRMPKVGQYVSYLFKRPKLMKLMREEIKMNFAVLDDWIQLRSLKKKLADLKGEDYTSKDYPDML